MIREPEENGFFLITVKDPINNSEHTMAPATCTENEKLVSSSMVQGNLVF